MTPPELGTLTVAFGVVAFLLCVILASIDMTAVEERGGTLAKMLEVYLSWFACGALLFLGSLLVGDSLGTFA